MTAPEWIRALPARYGRRTLIALALIAVLGLGLRAYAVVHPVANPADDSHAYFGLAKALYVEGSYGGPEFRDSSDWSPGAPLLYAASFFLTGGAREGTARIVEALMGTAAILVVFALGARLAGRGWRRGGGEAPPGADPARADPVSPLARSTGLLAAFAVAVYPSFIHSTGELMSEPPAVLTLPAAVLAFLWAGEKERWWAWLVPGLLFGLTAMFRPEYLFVAAVFVVLAAVRVWSARGPRPALAGAAALLLALLVAIVPWTVRNLVVLERLVPISTGSGKALYVGTFYPADGEYQRVKAILYERYEGKSLPPNSEALNEVDPTPLFDRAANEYKAEQGEPGLSRDAALGKLGKEDFSEYFGEDPLGYLGMTARKVGRMWSSGVGEAMSSTPGRAVQLIVVFAGLAGFVLLGVRRRWWELASLAAPIVVVTAVGAISLAAPRRNEVLMTLVFPLAALALSSAVSALSSRREWSPPPSPPETSSQPS
ncbi:MAG TPA: glycosyltransferase family 39 protein [Solirubrobacterales bacterium]